MSRQGPEAGSLVALFVNGRPQTVSADPDTALLYVLRNDLGLKGTRFGCGTGYCGACMVIVDGRAQTSCDLPLQAVEGKHVTTIEGLRDGDRLDALQQACIEEGAGQCGFCLSGILMSAKALLDQAPNPGDREICEALDANICRCGSQPRILRAVRRAAEAGPT